MPNHRFPRASAAIAAGLVFATVFATAGCPNREVSRVDPGQEKEEFKDIPLTINRDIDILFVIDNSMSMGQEQASLVANFPKFTQILDNIEGGLPNVHIGVVSSDMGSLNTNFNACGGLGDNGGLRKGGGDCGINGQFIRNVEDGSGGRITNHGANDRLSQAFACAAELGDQGCGFEQHLEAMRAALTNNTVNAGFLRPNAKLAVVIVADEDDCSVKNPGFWGPQSEALGFPDSFRCTEFGIECEGPSDPRTSGPRTDCAPIENSQFMYTRAEIQSRYVDFLKGLKQDPMDIIVAGIIGNVEPVEVGRRDADGASVPALLPSCRYPAPGGGEQNARPGVRLRYFLEQFPNRNQVTTICDDDLSDALVQIAELLATVIGNPCIEGNLKMPVECVASYVTDPGQDNEVEQLLPKCSSDTGTPTNQPCWRLIQDPNCTDYPTGLSIEVVRTQDPPPDTHIFARCATE